MVISNLDDKTKQQAAYLAAFLLAAPWLAQPAKARALSPVIEAAQKYAPEAARQAFIKLYATVEKRLADLETALRTGSIQPGQVVAEMEQIIQPAYERASLFGKLAAGRLKVLSPADMTEVDKQWAAEAKFAKGLASDLAAGKVSDARLAQRLQMYAHGVREVYNRAWAHHKTTPLFRWHMHDGAEHCVACIAASNGSGANLPAGFYRLAELPFYPGRSPVCLTNCMCWLEAADGDVGAPQIREPAKGGETPAKETTNG